MRTKKYWQSLSEQHYKDLQEARNLVDLKGQALKFLLKSSDTYRVELTGDQYAIYASPYFKNRTRFEYVDGNGTYHNHYRDVDVNDLEVISTNAETAVIKFKLTGKRYSYWILNKADETIAEIPEGLICDKGTKICENKEDFICLIKT